MKKERNSLVLQSFGRENEYKRAILTVLSFYAHCSLPVEQTRVLLFTDQPEYFSNYLQGLPVEYVLLTPEKIKSMRGEIDFLHRMKIAVIEEAFALSAGAVLYADSDSFFIQDPAPLIASLSEAKAFMHLAEYTFQKDVEDKTNTYKNFYALINRQEFALTSGSRLTVTPEHWSWNAGVMMLHPSHARFIPDVYALTSQFYNGSQSHASEQYAFSLVLQEHIQLEACDHVIYHYWYRVKKQIVDHFLNGRFNKIWSSEALESKLAQVKAWTALLPGIFKNHVWVTRDHAIQAFNKNKFSEGYRWASKAFFQKPFNSGRLLKDTLYHLKRQLMHK
jgi:hypothetical protein